MPQYSISICMAERLKGPEMSEKLGSKPADLQEHRTIWIPA
jgi:hypothetical protein